MELFRLSVNRSHSKWRVKKFCFFGYLTLSQKDFQAIPIRKQFMLFLKTEQKFTLVLTLVY